MTSRVSEIDAVPPFPEAPGEAASETAAVPSTQPAMTFRRTVRLIKSDYVRMASHYQFPLTFQRAIEMTILPATIALVLYRWSHYFHERGWRLIAWPLYSLNVFLTGADIVPSTVLGSHCLLGHSVGTVLSGRIGRYATILAKVGVGGGRGPGGEGNEMGLPTIGDFVTLGVNCTVMGPIIVGDYATVGAHSLVLNEVPRDGVVMGAPARLTRLRKPGEGWYGTIEGSEGGVI